MKFLYEENREYTETHELFSAEEIKAHIDRYYKDSRAYFQPSVDRQALSLGSGLKFVGLGIPLTLIMGLSLYGTLNAGASLSDAQPALFCVLFGVGCVFCLLGGTSLINALTKADLSNEAQKGKDKTGLMLFNPHDAYDDDDSDDRKKGKGKDKKGKDISVISLPKPKNAREEAFQDLLGRGRLLEGKISEIVDLESNLRQITFHFSPDGQTTRTSAYITESSVDLPLYETLIVLTNGVFTVLL